MKQQTKSLLFSFSLCSGERKKEREGWWLKGSGGILSLLPTDRLLIVHYRREFR